VQERIIWLAIALVLAGSGCLYLIRLGKWWLALVMLVFGGILGWLSLSIWPYCCP
jgi:hypothetical protein